MSNQILDHKGTPVAHGWAKANYAVTLGNRRVGRPGTLSLRTCLEGYRQVFHAAPPADLAAACKTGQAQ
jgi:hypothetical protein